jgi:hypothetical protein
MFIRWQHYTSRALNPWQRNRSAEGTRLRAVLVEAVRTMESHGRGISHFSEASALTRATASRSGITSPLPETSIELWCRRLPRAKSDAGRGFVYAAEIKGAVLGGGATRLLLDGLFAKVTVERL